MVHDCYKRTENPRLNLSSLGLLQICIRSATACISSLANHLRQRQCTRKLDRSTSKWIKMDRRDSQGRSGMTSQTSSFTDEQQEANRKLATEALVLLSAQPLETGARHPDDSGLTRTRRRLPNSRPKRPVQDGAPNERQPRGSSRGPLPVEAAPREVQVCPYRKPCCKLGALIVEAILSTPDKEMSFTLLNSYFRINHPWYSWGPRDKRLRATLRTALRLRASSPFEQVPEKPGLWRVKATCLGM